MAFPAPPPGFTTLNEAISTNHKFDVIGVCVDYLEATKSRGGDYTCKFTLHDPSWSVDSGLTFRFFHPSIEELPKIQRSGDIVILRNITIKEFQHQRYGMSNSTTSWVVLSASSIDGSSNSDPSKPTFVASSKGHTKAPAPTAAEVNYAKQIAQLEDPSNYRSPIKSTALQIENTIREAGGTPSRRSEKWRRIEDLTPKAQVGNHNFADLFGEVRKTWYDNFGRVELSLTDYTTNKLLHNYPEKPQAQDGDLYGYSAEMHGQWPGPWGRMTINVTLFDSHAIYAKSNVVPGMYVWIRNCQIKLDRDGTRLEAACRGDVKESTKVNVIISKPSQAKDDPKFRDLLKRRLEYEELAKKNGLRFDFGKADRDESKKRALGNDQVTERTKDNSAGDQKRMTKAMKKRARKENQANTKKDNPENMKKEKPENATNQHVRLQNIVVPVTPISSILDITTLQRKTPKGNEYTLPFQNCSYKVKVRVVDYWPNDLADFSIPYRVSDYDALSDVEDGDDTTMTDLPSTLASAQNNPQSVRWEWRFFLVVEDASPGSARKPDEPRPQMALLVAGGDGDYLFNAEASDLRANPQSLAQMKEKLFFLWNDLQEKKEDAAAAATIADSTPASAPAIKAQSKPFECFVKEYGIPLPGQHSNKSSGGSGQDIGVKSPVEYQRMFQLFGITV